MINIYIMSGIPGSGKTHQANGFATVMAKEGEEGVIISADHYFCPELTQRLGQKEYFGIPFELAMSETLIQGYVFDASKLSLAHQQCMKAFVMMVSGAKDAGHKFNLIVDNTNINSFEIAPYYLVGEAFGANVEILRVQEDLDVCIKRNIHGVPSEVITRMHKTFSTDVQHPWEADTMMPKQHMPWWSSRII